MLTRGELSFSLFKFFALVSIVDIILAWSILNFRKMEDRMMAEAQYEFLKSIFVFIFYVIVLIYILFLDE
jgi:hypothetical protein